MRLRGGFIELVYNSVKRGVLLRLPPVLKVKVNTPVRQFLPPTLKQNHNKL